MAKFAIKVLRYQQNMQILSCFGAMGLRQQRHCVAFNSHL